MKKLKHSNNPVLFSLLMFTLIIAHFSATAQYSKEELLLKLLSSQEIEMLNNVVKGKSDLHKTLLSSNFILQNSSNKEFTKKGFIENYILNPKIKFESLSAVDFRIVTSNENTLVMTCIETIKLEGIVAKSVSVIMTFTKEKSIWKLIYKKAVNL